MNNIELSDEEKKYLSDYNRYNNKISMSEIYDFIDKILNDRYNKGKEEGIKSMQEKLCTKCGRFHSEGDICEELLPF